MVPTPAPGFSMTKDSFGPLSITIHRLTSILVQRCWHGWNDMNPESIEPYFLETKEVSSGLAVMVQPLLKSITIS